MSSLILPEVKKGSEGWLLHYLAPMDITLNFWAPI